METRTCSLCKKVFSTADFGKDKKQKSGLKSRCRVCTRNTQKADYIKNKEARVRQIMAWKKRNMPQYLEYQKKLRAKSKRILVDGYGGCCSCCGETAIRILTLEHKNNDGKHHRKTHRNITKLYKDVISKGFPDNYTILCFSCNFAVAKTGTCPCTRKIVIESLKNENKKLVSILQECVSNFERNRTGGCNGIWNTPEKDSPYDKAKTLLTTLNP